MREYELLYIVSGDLSESDATKVTDEVVALIDTQGGKIAAADAGAENGEFQGRRKLAYPIGKEDHGWYVITRFTIEPAKVIELQRGLNLKNAVVRSLIVAASEIPTAEERAKIDEARQKPEEEAKAKPSVKTPETVAKVVKPKPKAAAEPSEPEPKPAETAATEKERKSQLEAALSEKLSEE